MTLTPSQQSPESFVKAHLVDALGIAGIVALALTNRISGPIALGAILSIVGARTSIAAWKILRFVIALLGGISGGNGSAVGPSLPPPKLDSDKPEPPSSAFWALATLGKRAVALPAAVAAFFTVKGG